MSFAELFDLIDLKKKALDTLAGTFHAVWRRHAFFELDESMVSEVLARSVLTVVSK